VLDFQTARITFLFDDGGFPVYSPTGHILFTRGDTLLAVGFDSKAMKLTGSPVPLADGLRAEYAFTPAYFQLSEDGTLVYVPGGRTAESRRLGVLDAQGVVTAISDEAHAYQNVRASAADGKQFVTTITNGQGIDEMWLGEFDHPGLRRLLAIPGADVFTPILSRDGQRVAFGRRGRGAEDGIYVMSVEEGSAARRLWLGPDRASPTGDRLEARFAFSADERRAHQRRRRRFIAAMRSMGAYSLRTVDPGPGGSIHYAGTLPFADREQPLALDRTGRVHGTERVFEFPAQCPVCGAAAVREPEEAITRCTGVSSGSRTAAAPHTGH